MTTALLHRERVDYADVTSLDDVAESGDGGFPRSTWYRFLATGANFLPNSARNPGADAFMDELREQSAELGRIADRIEAAEAAGDAAAVDRLSQEADEHINENLPIVPTLALAVMMSNITEDLDSRRDLQAGIEDVRQALSTGNAQDAGDAYKSLEVVMGGVSLPDHEVPGVDANLLTRLKK